jgi:hypothetical protein
VILRPAAVIRRLLSSIDGRLVLRVSFVLLVVAAIALVAKLCAIAFDSRVTGSRMDRAIERATVGGAKDTRPAQPAIASEIPTAAR